ncbi:MAG: hypothetical protein A2Z08_02740 [Deltaproteobacteria bacterium RBG_16_54_11]|nr:MAG: hypothetical protein A2Z08_02740 [Deltaproteobacteria bacterium RBG_16_54_11]
MPQSGRDPVVHKNHIEVRGCHSDFAALRHDVLKRFKGASLYKLSRSAFIEILRMGCRCATERVLRRFL